MVIVKIEDEGQFWLTEDVKCMKFPNYNSKNVSESMSLSHL